MNYAPEPILHLTALILGKDESRIWLKENNFPELILVHYAIDGRDEALAELTRRKDVDLTAFVHAVQDDKRAYNYLAENKKFIWAATVRVTYKDPNAEAWLLRNNLPHFVQLGRAIRKNEEDEAADDIFGLMRKIMRFIVGNRGNKGNRGVPYS